MQHFDLMGIDINVMTNYELRTLGLLRLKDYPELGFSCLYHAYLRKDAEAAYHLSVCYLDGIGIPQSYNEYSFYEEESAKMGFHIAQRNFGKRLLLKSEEACHMLARVFLKKASDQDDIEAMYEYGKLCYKNKYFDESKYYLQKAYDLGKLECLDILKKIG